MKFLLVSLVVFAFVPVIRSTGSENQERKSNTVSSRTDCLSADSLSKIVLEVFSEAYHEFAQVTYEKVSDNMHPSSVSFLVPAKIVDAKYSEKLLEKRGKEIMQRLERIGCQYTQIGEAADYSWNSWADKRVKRVTFTFGQGC